jgi:hypothetical protein
LGDAEMMTAGQARQIACDAQVIPMVLNSPSQPLDIGRSTRVISTPIRRALVERDGGCTFPGVRHEALSTNSEVRDHRYCYVAS